MLCNEFFICLFFNLSKHFHIERVNPKGELLLTNSHPIVINLKKERKKILGIKKNPFEWKIPLGTIEKVLKEILL